ncbi:MAG: UvrB/UvrC motif-containing protein, partial [Sedimenticola sp.]|nr:UvrB/UvrC motif-containing protein [Sedimenticola sp.]
MQRAIDETNRRREKQVAHNLEHNITPQSIIKSVADIMEGARPGGPMSAKRYAKVAEETAEYSAMTPKQMAKRIQELEKQMYQHAKDLEFEEAARVRDQLKSLQEQGLIA